MNRRNFGRGALIAGVVAGAGGFIWNRATDYPVIALVGDGVNMLDVVGPMEILGRLPHASPAYASVTGGSVKAWHGPIQIEQTLRLADCTDPKIIVVPGAVNSPNQSQIEWLKRSAKTADVIFAAGSGREWLNEAGLKPDRKKIISCEGGAAALDAALSVAASIAGTNFAKAVQLGIEYDPAPPFAADAQSVLPAKLPPLAIDILLYEGMTALDAIGPYEVFSRIPDVDIRLVGKRPGIINTDTGALFLNTDFGLEPRSNTDLVIIPGGSYGTLRAAEDPAIIKWVREHLAIPDRQIMSICTGALILAATGALKGLTATTHWAAEEDLNEAGAIYVHKRYVEHGRITTAAGVSAGIDVALELLGKLRGEAVGAAVQAALPYAPAPPFKTGSIAQASPQVISASEDQLLSNAIKSAARIKYRELRGLA